LRRAAMPFKKGEKSYILITGASKGFGQAIASAFAQVLGSNSHFVLLGRDTNGLETTKGLLHKFNQGVDSKRFTVSTRSLDLLGAKAEDFENIFGGDVAANGYRQAIIVHNAGSTGDVSKTASQVHHPKEVTDYFTMNLSSAVALNSAFLDFAKAVGNKVVVQITSLCGVQPFKNMGLYCSGKAARDMFFQVLALEYPELQVLAWSPGPLEGTDMSAKVRTETADAATREMFEQLQKSDSYVRCDSSANKMIEMLEKNDFASGAHLDYFDRT